MPKFNPATVIPLLIAVCVFTVIGLHLGGVINVNGFLNQDSQNYLNIHNVLNPTTGSKDQNPIEYSVPPNAGPIPEKTTEEKEDNICEGEPIFDGQDGEIGKKYESKMSMKAKGTSTSPFKFFFYDSVAEALVPPGLSLSSDGTLGGVPTKKGSYDFEVCAENAEGDGKCFCIRVFIKAKTVPKPAPVPSWCAPCPTQSCETGNCCCETNEEGVIDAKTTGVLTLDCCTRCPNDTHEVGKDFTSSVHYKICQCNACPE